MGTLIRDAQGLLIAMMSKKQKFVYESNKIQVIATQSAEFTMDVGIRKVVLQRDSLITVNAVRWEHFRVVKIATTAIQKMGSQPPKEREKEKKKKHDSSRFSCHEGHMHVM